MNPILNFTALLGNIALSTTHQLATRTLPSVFYAIYNLFAAPCTVRIRCQVPYPELPLANPAHPRDLC